MKKLPKPTALVIDISKGRLEQTCRSKKKVIITDDVAIRARALMEDYGVWNYHTLERDLAE